MHIARFSQYAAFRVRRGGLQAGTFHWAEAVESSFHQVTPRVCDPRRLRDRERSPINLGCMGRAGSALPTADLSTATVDPGSPMAEQCFRHATWRALGGPRPEGPGPTAVSRRDHDTAHNDLRELRNFDFPTSPLPFVFICFLNKRRNALGTLNLGYKASRYKP